MSSYIYNFYLNYGFIGVMKHYELKGSLGGNSLGLQFQNVYNQRKSVKELKQERKVKMGADNNKSPDGRCFLTCFP